MTRINRPSNFNAIALVVVLLSATAMASYAFSSLRYPETEQASRDLDLDKSVRSVSATMVPMGWMDAYSALDNNEFESISSSMESTPFTARYRADHELYHEQVTVTFTSDSVYCIVKFEQSKAAPNATKPYDQFCRDHEKFDEISGVGGSFLRVLTEIDVGSVHEFAGWIGPVLNSRRQMNALDESDPIPGDLNEPVISRELLKHRIQNGSYSLVGTSVISNRGCLLVDITAANGTVSATNVRQCIDLEVGAIIGIAVGNENGTKRWTQHLELVDISFDDDDSGSSKAFDGVTFDKTASLKVARQCSPDADISILTLAMNRIRESYIQLDLRPIDSICIEGDLGKLSQPQSPDIGIVVMYVDVVENQDGRTMLIASQKKDDPYLPFSVTAVSTDTQGADGPKGLLPTRGKVIDRHYLFGEREFQDVRIVTVLPAVDNGNVENELDKYFEQFDTAFESE